MKALEKFKQEFSDHLQYRDYGWSNGKEISMKWVADHVVGDRVLDIGGTVALVRYLKKQKNILASIFDAFPPEGLDHNDCDNIYVGDISDLVDVIGDEKFDTITCRHTLEHCLNPLFVLWQINKLLCNGGKLIVVLPPYLSYWVWFYSHFNCLPEGSWEMLFWRSGFVIDKKEYGYWDNNQNHPSFREVRYLLSSETKDLRFFGQHYPKEIP
jgi:SAM-dependent methyltransferase